MTDQTTHLTEDDRQTAADGTLSAERRAHVEAHLATCDACATDVARIAEFMKRTRESTSSANAADSLDELWPPIRARIEATKIVALGPGTPTASTRPFVWLVAAGLAGAMVLTTLVLRTRTGEQPNDAVVQVAADSSVLRAVADSTKAYEAEAQILLDRLEIQRATMRPEARAAIDRNLHTVDVAIAELKDAIARDPRNPALRQLLATSYRQKVELLKRANAG
ncbi:MAG TPA: zf-HC2 domain-containing protein [Gemmatimonadaceae bacterium]|nr:zf-HC2 domain-containing protein [Gemmatimonadaceae bacterium]